jgi:hypothetical protein
LVIAATPIIQYAWTFFYLRLVEIDQPMIEVGPLYAKAEAPPHHPSEPIASLPEKHEGGPNGFSR